MPEKINVPAWIASSSDSQFNLYLNLIKSVGLKSFSDSDLVRIVFNRPKSISGLADIVGRKRARKFGRKILKTVFEKRTRRPLVRLPGPNDSGLGYPETDEWWRKRKAEIEAGYAKTYQGDHIPSEAQVEAYKAAERAKKAWADVEV